MAKFGRLRLLAVAVKRFLVQRKRHNREGYEALPSDLRERYEAAENRLSGSGTKRPQPYEESIRQVAEDIGDIIARFAEDPAITARTSDAANAAMARIFCEQCEVGAERRARHRPERARRRARESHPWQRAPAPRRA